MLRTSLTSLQYSSLWLRFLRFRCQCLKSFVGDYELAKQHPLCEYVKHTLNSFDLDYSASFATLPLSMTNEVFSPPAHTYGAFIHVVPSFSLQLTIPYF